MKLPKKEICLILTGMLLFCLLPLGAAAQEAGIRGIAFVNYETLRLREEPNTNSKELAKAQRNEVVLILNKGKGGWYRVSYNLQEGYMLGGYLRILTKENVELGYGQVIPEETVLYTQPDPQSEELCGLVQNDRC